MKRFAPFIAFIVLATLAALAWTFHGGQNDPAHGVFLGYVEGDLLFIGPIEGERVENLQVDVGQRVAKGDILFRMATPLLDQQRTEAAARLEQAEAQLRNLKAALSRPEQIAVLQAAVDRAEAALRLSTNDYERQKTLFARGHVSKAALDRAAMALDRDKASLEEAKRQIQASRIPSRTQEIDAAEAELAQTRARLDRIDVQIARQTVKAPAGGVVQDIYFRAGEMVNAGQPVLSLLPPENRKVRFYVPEPQLATIRLGARVRIECDGCEAGLWGRIFFVASREEYTPPVIFSDEERAKLVFKIEAKLEEKARELPLGLPVSVRLSEESKESG